MKHLPSLKHYKHTHKLKDLKEFMESYIRDFDFEFKLWIMMDEYCTNDVRILAHALVKYRAKMKGLTKIDIIRDTLTIASMAVNHFKQNYMPHLPSYAFPRVQPEGYFSNDIQSTEGRKWLKYQALKVQIFHHQPNNNDFLDLRYTNRRVQVR